MTTATFKDQQAIDAARKAMRDYFNDLGFTGVLYLTGDGCECLSRGDGMSVMLDPRHATVELTVIDKMITCSTGRLGFPNQNIPIFIRQLNRHIFD